MNVDGPVLVGGVLVGGVMGAGLAATLCLGLACSGPTKAPPGPVPAPTKTALSPPAPSTTGGPLATAPATDAGAGESDGATGATTTAAARAARQCDDPIGAILNLPDGGVIFNNAMTSADAGSLDRGQGIIDALVARAPQFRCCLDPWLRARPDQEAKLLLRVSLDPSGRVTEVGLDSSRSTVDDELAVTCARLVAEETSYPASPSKRATIVELPLRLVAQVR
ncbi:MAG: hypothetical protein JRI68_23900 [Deltaproteobacteria bacterium]|nr:hypothetical protein [Deltaproteobacteria bacterium]